MRERRKGSQVGRECNGVASVWSLRVERTPERSEAFDEMLAQKRYTLFLHWWCGYACGDDERTCLRRGCSRFSRPTARFDRFLPSAASFCATSRRSVQADEGFSPIDTELVGVPIYWAFDAAARAAQSQGLSYLTSDVELWRHRR